MPPSGPVDGVHLCADLNESFFEYIEAENDPSTGTFTGIVFVNVVPYVFNCPSGDPCENVSTMGAESQLMALQLTNGIIIEAASDLGGDDWWNPGRCLRKLTHEQRIAFLDNNCFDDADCNVNITAYDVDLPDGENDRWTIDGTRSLPAGGIKALICTPGGRKIAVGVLGQVTLTFGDIEAVVKP